MMSLLDVGTIGSLRGYPRYKAPAGEILGALRIVKSRFDASERRRVLAGLAVTAFDLWPDACSRTGYNRKTFLLDLSLERILPRQPEGA
jgi:hypothetical protein